MKKTLESTQIENELRGGSAFFSTRGETPAPIKVAQKVAQSSEQVSIRLSRGVSKNVSKDLSNGVSRPANESSETPAAETGPVSVGASLNTDEIEDLSFRLRKTPKIKANTAIPLEWKQELDDVSHELKVGKYDLLMFIIGRFLGHT